MKKKIEDATLRLKVSSRGGGVEISLDSFGFKGEKMAAYQNYLGGGMLGSIGVNNTIQAYGKEVTDKQAEKLQKIGRALIEYFHGLTNPDSEWESADLESLQRRPRSAY